MGAAGLGEARTSFWRRHRWLPWVGAALLLVAGVLAGTALYLRHEAEPYLRARIVQGLQERFHARVELDQFHMTLADGVRAEGHGLRIWPPARVKGVEVPATAPGPLISLDEFRFRAPLHFAPGEPFRISLVELKGLNIHLPPKSHFEHAEAAGGEAKAGTRAAAERHAVRFDIGTIQCTGAELVLETSKPGKLPLDFAIANFKLTRASAGGAMGFDAELTNPRPVGAIHATGSFGPWVVADPGESAIQGQYTFDHADLGGFKGIAGILSSTGKYEGTLRDITVDGETDTPDFRLTHFGNAMPLHTHFHARVDGTNGDTWLDPVDATLGRSHFTAQGQVVRVLLPPEADTTTLHPSAGHDIDLTVNVDRARIEDFLHLASKSNIPLLTGAVEMKTRLHIPPGPAPIHKRLSLKGTFQLDEARFTSQKVQDSIEQLSLRGQGRSKELKTADSSSVRSSMAGNFNMANGVLTLPDLTYKVPGATIQLKGTYGAEGVELNFIGTARLEATVSQMVGGLLGVLVKPADRFFKKDGAGTVLRIHISGTREAPEFGIDFDRMRKKPADAKP